MNFRVRMGKMEKQCIFFSGFLDVEILIAIFFQFRICVFLSCGDCVFFLDRVTPGSTILALIFKILKHTMPCQLPKLVVKYF